MRIAGRHLPSTSLASFQSKSNPVFEPAPAAPNSSISRHGLLGRFHAKRSPLPRSFIKSSMAGRGRGDNPLVKSNPLLNAQFRQASGRLRPQKNRPAPSSLKTKDIGVDEAIETTRLMPPSPPKYDKGWLDVELEDAKGVLRPSVCGENWRAGSPVDEGSTKQPSLSPIPVASDGAWSVDGRPLLGSPKEELTYIESCERRSRELVEKVQANAAAELAQLRAYKARFEQLRADSAKHEAAAKQSERSHRETQVQLLSMLDEISKLERERDLEAAAREELKRKLAIVEMERDMETIVKEESKKNFLIMQRERDVLADAEQDWKMKLVLVEEERDDWREKAEELEASVTAVKHERDAIVIAMVRMRGEDKLKRGTALVAMCTEKNSEIQRKAMDEIQAEVAADLVADRAVIAQLTTDGVVREATSKLLAEAQTLSFRNLFEMHREVQEQLSAASEEKNKLERERDELETKRSELERRAQDAEEERDAVVLAVRSEWDAVKLAIREGREKLEKELNAAREEKSQLERKLGAAQIAASHDNKKLEGERDINMKLRSERDAIAIARREAIHKLEDQHDAWQLEIREKIFRTSNKSDISMFETSSLKSGPNNVRGESRRRVNETEEELVAFRDGNKKQELSIINMRPGKSDLEAERKATIASQDNHKTERED